MILSMRMGLAPDRVLSWPRVDPRNGEHVATDPNRYCGAGGGVGCRRSLRRLATAVAVALGVGLLGPVSPASAAGPNAWTADGGDAGNATNNPGETVITAATARRLAQAWVDPRRTLSSAAPVVVNGVAHRVVTTGNVGNPSTLTALSARTGATLWTVELPGLASYISGMSVAGNLLLVPFNGSRRAGGVLAVNLQTRRIVWSSDLPPAAISWMGNAQAGPAYTDGTRVFVSGAGNAINAYRLSDGALLWTAPITYNTQGTPNRIDGRAVGGSLVFTGGAEGIVAYDTATGQRRWTAPGASGTPVVAGGRVFGVGFRTVLAFSASGCGRSTCSPLWTTTLPAQVPDLLALGGADGSTLFLTYRTSLPPPPGGVTGTMVGNIARLSASTGRIQWSTTIGRINAELVRAGNTVWLINEYVTSTGSVAQRIVAFSTTATGSAPLHTFPSQHGFPQSLAVASGSLLHQARGPSNLISYRIPGT
jgi:outer membrane protein assembly factor BamB